MLNTQQHAYHAVEMKLINYSILFPYEIGTGVGTSITQLAEMISEEAGGHLQISMEPDVIQTAPRLVARSPALSSFIPLSEGIKLVMKFIREAD